MHSANPVYVYFI
uniref:Uncharacterized protein n=1 Tax=Rhizophora mucronata TaxID=61149 RepID=A0A2P2PH17_RHIMU